MWQISWQVAAVPVTELAVPVRGPIYAGYAKVQHDRALLRRHFLGGFGFLCAAVTPLSVGIALVAQEVERLALGPAFAGAAALIAYCALWAYVDAMAHFTFNLFVVLDAQRRMVATYVLLVLVRVPAVIAGALLAGAEGVGVALVATALLNALVWHTQVARLLGHGPAELWAELWRSLAAAGVMAAAVTALRAAALPPPGGPGDVSGAVLNLAVLAGFGACVHIGTQFVLWRLAGAPEGAERRLLARRERRTARPGPAAAPRPGARTSERTLPVEARGRLNG
jgi:PST family polysaccharide transporter